MQCAERLLPHDLLERATLRGNEYAWRPDDIPSVIEAARKAGLVSVGGQLQFRFPDGGTCECYWVEVDTGRTVPSNLPWAERVTRTAEAALIEFRALHTRWDFITEGRTNFVEAFQTWDSKGGDPASAMWFVWYVSTAAVESKTPNS